MIDLAFVLEGSKNVTPKAFEGFKKFVKSSIDNMLVSESGTRVAVVEYSDESTVKIYLNDSTNPSLVKNAVDRIQPSRGDGVATDKALRQVADQVFSSRKGSRPGIPKVVVLLTVSKSTGDEPLGDAVKPLTDLGVRVYVIAVGGKTDADLEDIVLDEGGIIPVPTDGQLPRLVLNALKKITVDVQEGEHLI